MATTLYFLLVTIELTLSLGINSPAFLEDCGAVSSFMLHIPSIQQGSVQLRGAT